MWNFAYYSKNANFTSLMSENMRNFAYYSKKCELCITNERNYGEFLVRLIFHGNSEGES